ncbi:DEKNAAC105208 [Brettanomyces naardenensis]|uniref:DEKNAAC105208 n=1 Tax=Brettanomyces naardenensis TaxID=13370 RepID=A0A448YT21_BRENA|nr:DEKNAAC105208 [Brettanomyces naardenensis]
MREKGGRDGDEKTEKAGGQEGKSARDQKTAKEIAMTIERARTLTDEAINRSRKAYKRSKTFTDLTINRSLEFKDKTMERSREFKDLTMERSREFKDLTMERSKELKDLTIQKSLELRENITKILPPDIHENIYTLPNFLTLTRLICAPIVGYMVLHKLTTGALCLFVYSCITDFFDGLIARRWDLKSIVGSIIDPIADKALMIICTVCLTMTSEVPLYLATLILGRDVMLGIAGVVVRYVTLPAPKTLLRYFDFSIVTVEVHPAMISKINTALQMVYLGTMMIKPLALIYLGHSFGSDAVDSFLSFITYFEWTVAATTIWSGLTYLIGRKAVKFLVPGK